MCIRIVRLKILGFCDKFDSAITSISGFLDRFEVIIYLNEQMTNLMQVHKNN